MTSARDAGSFDPLGHSGRRRPRSPDCAMVHLHSGTPGLPRRPRRVNRRVVEWGGTWFAGMLDTRPDGSHYDCSPMLL